MIAKKINIGLIVLAFCLLSISLASALTITSVSTSPNELAPGEVSLINIEIENDGNNDVEDVSVSLDLTEVPFAPFDSSSERGFDEILEGKSKEAEFQIVAFSDAGSEIYKIPVKITYTENSQLKIKDSLISLTVSSEPVLGVNIENGFILTEQESQMTVRVTNKGLSDVKFLEVELQRGKYYTILGPDKVYIGDVSSDDFDTAEFNVLLKENAPLIVNIPVTIVYKDALNKEYREELNLDLRVYSQDEAFRLGLIKPNNTVYYIAAVVVLIIIWIVYRRIKKRRKAKKAIE